MTGEKSTDPLVLSLDAMGGDRAPDAVLYGADAFLRKHRGRPVRFLLFGDGERLCGLLKGYPDLAAGAGVRHAPGVIRNEEKPSRALRNGRDTSMWMAIGAVREGEARACVSGGNTGALMALSRKLLAPVVERPAIASMIPNRTGWTVMLDLGANVSCQARHLVDFAQMGAQFARIELRIERPRLALLNIGNEETKGSGVLQEAAGWMRNEEGLAFDFRGFIEPDRLLEDEADVIVTDGFTGNVALKSMEGAARFLRSAVREGMKEASLVVRLGFAMAAPVLRGLRRRFDPRNMNGGVFLGVNGIVVKSHGGADGVAYRAAIARAATLADNDLVGSIARQLAMHTVTGAPPQEGESR